MSLELTTSLHALQISHPSKAPPKPKKAPVADSWDDEDLDDDDDDDADNTNSSTPTSTSTETESTLSRTTSLTLSKPPSEGPLAPPPTPASPTSGFTYDLPYSSLIPTSSSIGRTKGTASEGGSGASTPPSSRRPDKTTAVAGRLIAGALGVRAPKRTEEEREYDRVMRGKEKERREREREERGRRAEEEEAARRKVWED
ncbi:hypothetical protein W97_00239 [Coniosporium apollinis CBS 100218]|uniref:Uncharacterized protein n=1 Tax=Coniosporium apollinis (strain CBS 100218) TaxID=1168221 RepID=R7YGT6_CONA1|nr:uncharacterized protein W97_00239 [Coniosporium apollinis CBS 100218]EON61029.1 hypothetical protein W97_00239 [Coniosporium apollinis CBS 100218]